MFHINTTRLRDTQRILEINLNNINVTGHLKLKSWDVLTSRLVNKLEFNINKSRELLNKLEFSRNKRGLFSY